MATPAKVEGPKIPAGHQEGSRWVNRKPTGEEVATWFRDNVKLHPELQDQIDKYVQGVVIIGGRETMKEAREASNGQVTFVDVQRMTYTPYAKVETRVAYFWDLMAAREEWLGVIEPVEHARLDGAGVYNLNLPPGFFRLPIATGPNQFAHYIGCTMRIRILERATAHYAERVRKIYNAEGVVVGEESHEVLQGTPVAVFPPATKQISTLTRSEDEDPFSVMKAETGAIGRALGMAGMLVIPGSGIATAEDMHEAQSGASGASVTGPAAPPPVQPVAADDGALEVDTRERIQTKIAELQSRAPDAYEKLAAWASERKIDLADPKATQLRGLELQLDRGLKAIAAE